MGEEFGTGLAGKTSRFLDFTAFGAGSCRRDCTDAGIVPPSGFGRKRKDFCYAFTVFCITTPDKYPGGKG